MLLDKEIELFEKNLPDYIKQMPNLFVVIKNEDVQFFPNKEFAINYGLDNYGHTGCFLVRQIVEKQPEFFAPALTHGLHRGLKLMSDG